METLKGATVLGLFIGNLAPLFLVVSVIYYGTPLIFPLLLSITIISFMLNLLWWRVLSQINKLDTPSNTKTLDIKEADDLGSLVISYFLTYTLSLPSVAVIGGIKGLVVLIILLIIIYVVLEQNSIMLYNPFLSFRNYRLYKITTTTQSVGYLLVKKHPGIDRPLTGEVRAVHFRSYLYIKKN